MEKLCIVADCTRSDINGRGLCNMHYARYLRHGDPLGGHGRATLGPAQALSMHSTNKGSCRVWTGSSNGKGYGLVRVSGRLEVAHRVAFELANGKIPEGAVIDHMCHNKACINTKHLRAVTPKQNLENNGVPNKRNRSGVRGVYWSSQSSRWIAQVCHNYRKHHAGTFATLAEAEAAVIAKRLELFTHNDMDRMASA